jgi:NACHT domain
MAVLWGVVILAITSSTIANIFTTSTTTPLSQLNIIHWIIIYRTPLFFVAGGLLLLTALSWIGSRESKADPPSSPDQQRRLIILKTLRKEYTDELAASLQGMARIALELHERFDLTHPERLSTWRSRQLEKALPAGTDIVDAYDQAGNGLLILGEPGAGKSTLLYDLAQALLLRAEQSEQHPLPVILNLSLWATRRLSLQEWLVGELSLRYGIPSQLSQRWIQQEKFLPLLDGLDEVAASARNACIEAINTYHSEHGIPLVVCSRREEYEAASKQLTLQSAVIVQLLTTEQVKTYLKNSGRSLAAVRKVIDTNTVLRDLLTTPLMLSVVTLTYRGKAVKDLPQLGSAEAQQHQVFDHYVSRMLDQRKRKWRYASRQTYRWLIWLAKQMKQHQITEFYLEQLQPSWLSTKQPRIVYALISGLAYSLLVGLVFGLVFGLIGGPVDGLIGGLVGMLGSWLIFGLVRGLLTWLTDIKPAEKFVWSWKRCGKGLLFGLFYGICGGLLVGLVRGMLGELLGESKCCVVSINLNDMLFFGLLIGPTYSLLRGLSGTPLTSRQALSLSHKPNQGIHTSGWNALRLGLVFFPVGGLIGGLLGGLSGGLLGGPVLGLGGGLGGGLVSGLVFGLIFGLGGSLVFGLLAGRAYFQHYLLRLVLAQSRILPWRTVPFLEEATECILLQRVGGGYRFIHPLFRDYFASLNTIAPSPTVQSPSSRQI